MESELKQYMANVDEVISLLKQKVERIENERDEWKAKLAAYGSAIAPSLDQIRTEATDLAKNWPGNEGIYMGKREGVSIGYIAAAKKYLAQGEALRVRCERLEKALKEIEDSDYPITQKELEEWLLFAKRIAREAMPEYKKEGVVYISGIIANEALKGEGEKEVAPDGGKILVCNNSDAFRYWTANIKGYRIAHKGKNTVVWLPKGMTSEMLAKEWGEYENSNNQTSQKEDKQ